MTRGALRSPVKWMGSKGRLAPRIVASFPPCKVYLEPFGGSAAVLLARPPAHPPVLEVYNDLDGGLVNFFRVLRDPDQLEELQRILQLTPYAREEWKDARETWEDLKDPVARAASFFVVSRQSFAGIFAKAWGFDVAKGGTLKAYLGAIEGLPQVAQRLRRVQVDCVDWRVALDRYGGPDTLVYMDPPYHPDTRRDGVYRHDLTPEDHEDLLEAVLASSSMIVLSGYDSPAYDPLDRALWRKATLQTTCGIVARTRASGFRGNARVSAEQTRREVLFFNPAALEARGLGEMVKIQPL